MIRTVHLYPREGAVVAVWHPNSSRCPTVSDSVLTVGEICWPCVAYTTNQSLKQTSAFGDDTKMQCVNLASYEATLLSLIKNTFFN